MKTIDPARVEREEAWLGDAVLGLFARQYILERDGRMDQTRFTAMTSNLFLSTVGNPTRVESRIGAIYRSEGLQAAFAFIEANLLPLFLKQEKNRR